MKIRLDEMLTYSSGSSVSFFFFSNCSLFIDLKSTKRDIVDMKSVKMEVNVIWNKLLQILLLNLLRGENPHLEQFNFD